MKKENLTKLIFFLIIMLLLGGLGVFLSPYISELNSLEDANRLIEPIRELGILGAFVFTTIQMMQVVIFVIPGEVIEVIAGILYGTFFGFILCMCGIALGTTIIFTLAKKLGFSATQALFNNSNNKITNFINNKNNLTIIIFILFFIPGTPKDMITYFAPFTSVTLKKFLLITLIARVPSVLSSTFIGARLLEGDIFVGVVLYSITGLIALAVYLYTKFKDKKHKY